MGSIIKRAHRSGCNSTKKQGSQMMPINGIKPSMLLCRRFLYFVQNADADNIIESLRNSVGCREKGIPGMSNHPRAPFIFTQKMRTSKSITMTHILIILTCFFHQR